MLARLKTFARRLKSDLAALGIAARDPRTPWYVRAFALLVVAYALSPIDLIPDFVPVLGYLDDLLLVPLGLWLALRLVPPEVLRDARERAAEQGRGGRSGWGAALVLLIWLAALGLAAWRWWARWG